MNENTPNPAPADEVVEEVVTSNEPAAEGDGTEQTATVQTEHVNHDDVDYRKKFIDSQRGAHELLARNKELEAALAAKESATGNTQDINTHSPDTTNLYPGFEELDPEAQKNLIAYTDAVTKRAVEEVSKNPAISYAEKSYNENKWESAFDEVQAQFPELSETKDDFKAKYFSSNNVPDNISEILTECAKSYLFDKAREIGAQEGVEVAQRVQLEEPTGGDKTPTAHRSLADWQRMAQQNPAEFAKHKEQYEADLASGKLKE